ncbi:hypothetical protein EO95_16045 [Methanosarcina sp. 1.H.T.1A.1]|nr:hypothetical protein EO95_16045 [Methanosarcina sp. 1.H.T.1A.1]
MSVFPKHIHPFVFYRVFIFPICNYSIRFLLLFYPVLIRFFYSIEFLFSDSFSFFHIISVKNYAASNLRERVYFSRMKITLDVKKAYFEIESLMFFCK